MSVTESRTVAHRTCLHAWLMVATDSQDKISATRVCYIVQLWCSCIRTQGGSPGTHAWTSLLHPSAFMIPADPPGQRRWLQASPDRVMCCMTSTLYTTTMGTRLTLRTQLLLASKNKGQIVFHLCADCNMSLCLNKQINTLMKSLSVTKYTN